MNRVIGNSLAGVLTPVENCAVFAGPVSSGSV